MKRKEKVAKIKEAKILAEAKELAKKLEPQNVILKSKTVNTVSYTNYYQQRWLFQ